MQNVKALAETSYDNRIPITSNNEGLPLNLWFVIFGIEGPLRNCLKANIELRQTFLQILENG